MKAKVQRPRVLVTPSEAVWKLLGELNALSGKPKATVITEMLDTVAPVFADMVELFKKLQKQPETAKQLVEEYGWEAVQTIAQAQLDFKKQPRKQRRKRKGAGDEAP